MTVEVEAAFTSTTLVMPHRVVPDSHLRRRIACEIPELAVDVGGEPLRRL
jgi:hypothetical protein